MTLQTDSTPNSRNKNFPKVAGVLNLVAGGLMLVVGVPVFIIVAREGGQSFNDMGWLPLSFCLYGVVAVAGGIFALKRRLWGMALAGAICSIGIWLGIAAIVLLAISKDEFKRRR